MEKERSGTAFSSLEGWHSQRKNSEVILIHPKKQYLHFYKNRLPNFTLDRNIMAHNATNIPAKSVKQILERECVLTVNYMSRCLQGNRWFSPPASMTSRLASVTFKMANKVFIEKTNKNFEFITAILFRFLGSGDFESSQCYRKTDFGTFLE